MLIYVIKLFCVLIPVDGKFTDVTSVVPTTLKLLNKSVPIILSTSACTPISASIPEVPVEDTILLPLTFTLFMFAFGATALTLTVAIKQSPIDL